VQQEQRRLKVVLEKAKVLDVTNGELVEIERIGGGQRAIVVDRTERITRRKFATKRHNQQFAIVGARDATSRGRVDAEGGGSHREAVILVNIARLKIM
jgi:hypothetical protein